MIWVLLGWLWVWFGEKYDFFCYFATMILGVGIRRAPEV